MLKKLQALFAPRDLTVGNPMTGIAMFAVPLLIGNLAQQLYNTVDAIVVGNYVGDAALGAVGLGGAVLNLILVLFMGISTGATIVVSQYFGAKDRERLSHAVGTTITLTVISGIIMSVVGMLLSRPLLKLLGTSDAMIGLATDYLVIIMLGLVGNGLYNILSGVMRGLGDSTSPLIYLMVACFLNIILDLLFVAVFGMTTDGVAWATIIAQAVSAVLCVRRLWKMTEVLDLNRSTLRMDKAIVQRVVKLGVPAGLTQMIFALSNILVQSLTTSLGDFVVTATTAIMRVDGFAMMPNFTFGIAATTFTGQNVGAKRWDRVKQGAKDTLLLAVGTATVLVAGILFFGKNLMQIFTSTPEIVELGVGMMRLLAVGYIAFAVTQTWQGVMRGAGETMIPMWISIVTTVIIRMPLAYLWAYLTRSPQWPNGNPVCLYGSLLTAWIAGCLLSTLVYFKGKWRKRTEDALKDDPEERDESILPA
ncbi:MAG: MATE family efflux transporter [Clostridia bacterium]|nr:MATE family efflux transporter [Clostridia bacterium]